LTVAPNRIFPFVLNLWQLEAEIERRLKEKLEEFESIEWAAEERYRRERERIVREIEAKIDREEEYRLCSSLLCVCVL
jgi:hypothetical protein